MNKQVNKIFVIVLMSIFCLGFVNAESGIDLKIHNDTIIVEGWIVSDFGGKVAYGIIDKVETNITSNPLICQDLNVTEGNTSRIVQTNCTYVIDYHLNIPFLNANDTTQGIIIGDTELQRKYETCLEQKAAFNAGLNSCSTAKNEQSGFESNYTKCATDLQVCQSERATAQTETNRLTTEINENGNQQWVWGIGGLIIGILGTLYYCGRLGGPKSQKPDENFNRQQAA